MIELLLGIIAYVIGSLMWVRVRTVKARSGVWDEAARLLGLPAGSGQADVLGGARLAGEVDGFWLEVVALRGEEKPRRLRFVVDGRERISPRLALRPEGLASAVAKSLGHPDVEIGAEDFDRAVLVEGNPVLLSALLDLETRRQVRTLVVAGLRVEGGRIVLGHDEDTGDPRRLAGRSQELLELAARLVEPASPVERLARIIRDDPLPGVRRVCLQRLIERFPHHETTLGVTRELLEHPDGELRLDAARHLGEEGRDTLIELTRLARSDDYLAAMAVTALGPWLPLERASELLALAYERRSMGLAGAVVEALGANGSAPARGWLADILRGRHEELAVLAARALGSTADPATEPALLAALATGSVELRLAAVEALRSVGTAAAIPALRGAAGSGLAIGDLARAATRAIAAIQGRLACAAPGQLALADSLAGGLALAEGPSGAVSLGEDSRESRVESRESPTRPVSGAVCSS